MMTLYIIFVSVHRLTLHVPGPVTNAMDFTLTVSDPCKGTPAYLPLTPWHISKPDEELPPQPQSHRSKWQLAREKKGKRGGGLYQHL